MAAKFDFSQLRERVERWREALLGLVFPECCQICGGQRANAAEGYVCGNCWEKPGGVRFIRPPFCRKCGLPFWGESAAEFQCGNCRELDLAFDYARAAVAATPLLLDVVHRYKYDGALWFEPFLGDLLARAARPALAAESWDYLAPVPLHPDRERERGFNQSERLARWLGALANKPVRRNLLRRIEWTETQTMLTRGQRTKNVKGAFALGPGASLRQDRVVLIDDIMTTGSTASACARALLENGAAAVSVWTVARGLRT